MPNPFRAAVGCSTFSVLHSLFRTLFRIMSGRASGSVAGAGVTSCAGLLTDTPSNSSFSISDFIC